MSDQTREQAGTATLEQNEDTATTAPPVRRRGLIERVMGMRGGGAIITAINVAIFAAIWETYVRVMDVSPIFLPALSAIAEELVVVWNEGIYLPAVGSSLWFFVWSMALSIAIAVPVGLIVGAFPGLDRIFGPFMWASYVTPRIVFVPLILLWLGVTEWARLAIVLVSAVPPIMVVVLDGAKTAETSWIKAARSFGASRIQILRSVVVPSTMPFIGTGVRLGAARGLVGLFAAELFTAASGIGFVMYESSRQFNASRTFVMLLTFLVFSLLLVSLTSAFEKRMSKWRGQGASL